MDFLHLKIIMVKRLGIIRSLILYFTNLQFFDNVSDLIDSRWFINEYLIITDHQKKGHHRANKVDPFK